MAKSVLLPFCTPVFATVQSTAAVGLAMNGHPTAYNAILNQCASISCDTKFLRGKTTPMINIPHLGIHDFDIIDKFSSTTRFGVSHFREDIKKMLDEGYYVYFYGVDDYYIPGKCWYGIRHLMHDGIVCGYDDNDNTFSIASYDINWVFSLYKTPQECFMEGAQFCYEAKQYGIITAYKLKDHITVEIDPDMILKNIKNYLAVTIDKVPLDSDKIIAGIAVHDLLAMYVGKLKDGSISSDKLDWRAIRPVWEHKCAMLDRIRAVEKRMSWDCALSDTYAPLVNQANQIRGLYAMYHKNRRLQLLDKIGNGLIELRQAEHEILQELVSRMEVVS